MNPRIVVAGSLNTDLVVNVPRMPEGGETVPGSGFQIFGGGKGANQALAAARLGGSVGMLGQVGHDAFAELQLQNLAGAGVETDRILRDTATPTGTAVIAVEDSGQNRIIIVPGANGTFYPGLLEVGRDWLRQAEVVLLQLEIPIETVERAAALAREGPAKVILDPAPARPLSEGILRRVDYLTPNASELGALTGRKVEEESPLDRIAEAARSLCRRGAGRVIAKLGGRGALLVTKDTDHFWPAVPVRAVDTTAAGDCFNAAFAVALVEGRGELEAGRFACAAAACSVTRRGAQAGMPTRQEVLDLLEHFIEETRHRKDS